MYNRESGMENNNDNHNYIEHNLMGGDPTLPQNHYKSDRFYDTDAIEDLTNNEYYRNNKNRKKIIKFLASAIIFGLVAGTVFQSVDYITEKYIRKTNKETIASTDQKKPVTTLEPSSTVVNKVSNIPNDISTVVENVMPSIVSISSTFTNEGYSFFGQYVEEDQQASGSGFIVGENDKELLIVTNSHVVADSKSIQVTFIDTEAVEAVIKGNDAEADLAVIAVKLENIKSETKGLIKSAVLGSSDDVKVGQMAIAIGNSLGYGQSVTGGYISAKDREVDVSNGDREAKKMKLLQTDAAINPGNSGGPLLNAKGEVVGINSVKYASEQVEGMGYAIPISRALPIINELMEREILEEDEKGYLGISGSDVTEEVNKLYGIPVGVHVTEVAKDGAAEAAGIKKGDIITAINDIEITTVSALRDKANSFRVGTEVTLTVMRNANGSYEEVKVNATLKGSDTLDSLENSAVPQDQSEGSKNPSDKNNGDEDSSQQMPDIPGEEEYNRNGGYDEDTLQDFFDFFQ